MIFDSHITSTSQIPYYQTELRGRIYCFTTYLSYFGLFYARISVNGVFTVDIMWGFIMIPEVMFSTFQCGTHLVYTTVLRALGCVSKPIIEQDLCMGNVIQIMLSTRL